MAAALGTSGASLWWRLALLVQALGLLLVLFAAPDLGTLSGSASKALAILGILAMIGASGLVLVLVVLEEIRSMKPVAIVFIVLAYVAGFALIISVIIWNDSVRDLKDRIYMESSSSTDTDIDAKTHVIMSSMLTVCGCLCGFASATFGVVALVRPDPGGSAATDAEEPTAPKRKRSIRKYAPNEPNGDSTKYVTPVSFSTFGDSGHVVSSSAKPEVSASPTGKREYGSDTIDLY